MDCLIEDIGSYFMKAENREKLIIISDEEKQKGTVEYLKDMIDQKLEREILEGLSGNIKITTKEDLKLAEVLL